LRQAHEELELRVQKRTEALVVANRTLASQDIIHKRTEAALRESEARLRALIESIDELVFEFDGAGTCLNVWVENEELLVRPRRELLGRRIPEILGEEAARLL